MLLPRPPSSVPLVRTAQRPCWSGGRLPQPGSGLSGGGTTVERAEIEDCCLEGWVIGLYVSLAASPPWLCGVVPVQSLEILSRSRHGDAEFIYFFMCSQGGGSVGFARKKKRKREGNCANHRKCEKNVSFFCGGRKKERGKGKLFAPTHITYIGFWHKSGHVEFRLFWFYVNLVCELPYIVYGTRKTVTQNH